MIEHLKRESANALKLKQRWMYESTHSYTLSGEWSGGDRKDRANKEEKSIPELLWPGVVSGNSKGPRGMDTHTCTHTGKGRQIVKRVVGKVKNIPCERSRQRNKDRVKDRDMSPNSALLLSS